MHTPDILRGILESLPGISVQQNCYRSVSNASLYRPGRKPNALYALGPGLNGARYTPIDGPPCIYVSFDPVTTLCEAHGITSSLLSLSPTIEPTTFYTIKARLDQILDLTNKDVVAELGTSFAELDSDWEAQFKNGHPVPTHILATVVHACNRFQGIKFFSHEYRGKVI